MIQPDDLPTQEEYDRANPIPYTFSIDEYMDKIGISVIERLARKKEEKCSRCHYCNCQHDEQLSEFSKWAIIELYHNPEVFFICCPDCYAEHSEDHGENLMLIKHAGRHYE